MVEQDHSTSKTNNNNNNLLPFPTSKNQQQHLPSTPISSSSSSSARTTTRLVNLSASSTASSSSFLTQQHLGPSSSQHTIVSHERRPSNHSTLYPPESIKTTHSSSSSSTTTTSSPSGTRKLVKSTGRPKINTLPAWAQSCEDDDTLFQDVPLFPSSVTSTPKSCNSNYENGPTNGDSRAQKPLKTTITRSARKLTQSTLTLVSSSADSQEEFTLQKKSIEHAPLHSPSTEQHKTKINTTLLPSPVKRRKKSASLDGLSSAANSHSLRLSLLPGRINSRMDKKDDLGRTTPTDGVVLVPTIEHLSDDERVKTKHSSLLGRPLGQGNSNIRSASGSGSGVSGRRSFIRAVSTPSPVFQRFRPKRTITEEGKDEKRIENVDEVEEDASENEPYSRSASTQPLDDRWWQFTLPTKYRRKVEDYMRRTGHGIGGVQHQPSSPAGRVLRASAGHPEITIPTEMMEIEADRKRIIDLLKLNSSQHPPLLPTSGSAQINDSQYWRASVTETFDPFTPPLHGDFPLSAFSRKMSLTYAQQQQLIQQHTSQPESSSPSKTTNPPPNLRFLSRNLTDPNHPHLSSPTLDRSSPHLQQRNILQRLIRHSIDHVMAPLFFRLANFSMMAICLGICCRIKRIETDVNLSRVLGNSTLFVLVVAPAGMIHNLFAIYCEYLGAPIGIWSVSWKMFHTLSELVFISIWSAGLALSLDDQFTSNLKCSDSSYNQFSRAKLFNTNQAEAGILVEYRNKLCGLQIWLVVMIFFGLILYTLVLVVSLFRIFNRVSRNF